MAMGTRNTMASSDHQATRRATLMSSLGSWVAASTTGRAGCSACAVVCELVGLLFSTLANHSLPYLAPRPMSTTRKVSATT
jgi:hypothetical protein